MSGSSPRTARPSDKENDLATRRHVREQIERAIAEVRREVAVATRPWYKKLFSRKKST